jgi:hypothetical protein
MKTKLAIVLCLLGLAGCQQTSEVDKCVEAQAISYCNKWMHSPDNKQFYEVLGKGRAGCTKHLIRNSGGEFRLACLRAQSGK